ncbi:MAG TPA: hypothetical protein VGD89_13860 [Flavipsychrobacter sp.]
MKRFVIVLACLFHGFCVSAQKHHTYIDAGLSLAYFDPGFSVTYNYHPAKHLGVGIGTQGYVFHPASTNPRHFTPALFADVRLRIRPEKISQYFLFLDAGMNFYQHNNDSAYSGTYILTVPNDNGVYVGLGLGYFLRLTHRGWGAYASAKLINNIYKRNEYNTLTNEQNSINPAAGTLILSLGFRFGDDNKDYKVK